MSGKNEGLIQTDAAVNKANLQRLWTAIGLVGLLALIGTGLSWFSFHRIKVAFHGAMPVQKITLIYGGGGDGCTQVASSAGTADPNFADVLDTQNVTWVADNSTVSVWFDQNNTPFPKDTPPHVNGKYYQVSSGDDDGTEYKYTKVLLGNNECRNLSGQFGLRMK